MNLRMSGVTGILSSCCPNAIRLNTSKSPLVVPLGISQMMASRHDSGTFRTTEDGPVGVHKEPLHRLGQLRDEGRRDSIGPRRLVVRHVLLHGVLEVLQDVVLYRPPLVRYTPRDVGPDQPFKGRWVHRPLNIQRLPVPLDLPYDFSGLHEHFLRLPDAQRP